MKKFILFLMCVVFSLSIFSQKNIMTLDTLCTIVPSYLSEMVATDSGLLTKLSWDDLIKNNMVIMIDENQYLYSIGIGHQIDKIYYDAYIINYEGKNYYINNKNVYNSNVSHKLYYNELNNSLRPTNLTQDIDLQIQRNKNKIGALKIPGVSLAFSGIFSLLYLNSLSIDNPTGSEPLKYLVIASSSVCLISLCFAL